jgi:hypothetical protein
LAAETTVDSSYGNFFLPEDFKKELNQAIAAANKYIDLEFKCSGLNPARGFNTCKYP